MKIGKILVLAFLISAAIGFSFCAGYQGGRRATAAMPMRQLTEAPPDAALSVAGLSREEILQMLPGKTWYTHWETRNRDRPSQIRVSEDGQILVGDAAKNWKMEMRWVLTDGGHLFIPTDTRTLRGFVISTGRPKGLFADQ